MRIGIEAQRIFKQHKSASDQWVLDLIHGLMSIDDCNDYYIFVAPGPDSGCIQSASNFHVVELEALSSLVWEQSIFPREVERYALDILHCRSSSGVVRTPTRTLVTIDDENSLLLPLSCGTLFERLKHNYRRRLFRKAAERSWGLTADCQYERQLIAREDPRLAEKVKVIHRGISNNFLYDPSQSKRPENLPQDYLLYFGGSNPRKNMRNILKGYELYTKMTTREVMPLVVADVTGDELQNTLAESGICKIRDKIRLIGTVPNTLLPSLYRHASMLVSPVLRDANGVQIIEAMACGTVVLTSNTSCLGDIGGRASFLVNPFSPEEISHGIYKILNDKEARARMIEKSHDRVKHFMWPAVARRYQNIYMEMMSDEVSLPFSSENLIPS